MGRPVPTSRLPLALSLTAVIVAVLGLTPFGPAAANTVRRVAFAQETEAVRGLRVSAEPRAGRLLPLSSSARFSARVVPALPSARGPLGPVGVRGADGLPGLDGGEAVVRRREGDVSLGSVAELAAVDLDPGAWVLMAAIELSSEDIQRAEVVRCSIIRGGVELGYGRATVGSGLGGTQAATVTVLAASEHTNRARMALRCTGEEERSSVTVRSATLSALRVEALREYGG